MKKTVKTLVFITIISLAGLPAKSQLKLPFTAGIGPDIRRVIDDYPNHFNNLLGDLISKDPQSTDYACNFTMEGAADIRITQYSSTGNTICSWQALMLNTESFEKAKQKFKALYTQLNNLDTKAGHLKGNYTAPAEDKRFASILFSFSPADETIKKLKVELSLLYEEMEWKVRVLVYDREREDAEKGKTVEE
jgi:hypothetical protein